MTTRSANDRLAPLVLAAFLALLVGVNLVHARLDRTPAFGDSLDLLTRARDVRDALGRGGGPLVRAFFARYAKPPLAAFVGGLAFRVLPADEDGAAVVMQFFLVALVVAAYAVARGQAPRDGPWAAVLAAGVCGASPAILGQSRSYMTDAPAAAMVWVALALLLATRRHRRAAGSLLFGLACGLALLTKQSVAFFLVGPVLAHAAASLLDPAGRGRAARNLALAAAVAAAVAAPWYVHAFRHAYAFYETALGLPVTPGDLAWNGDYLRILRDEQLGWVFAAGAGAGLARLLWVRELRARFGPALVAGAALVLPPYLYFSSTVTRLSRFTLAFVPVLAIALAVGWLGESGRGEGEGAGSRTRPWRRGGAALLAAWGLFQIGFLSFGEARWREPRPLLERALGFPPASFYPGGTGFPVFRINRLGLGEGEAVEAISGLAAGRVRLLMVTDASMRRANSRADPSPLGEAIVAGFDRKAADFTLVEIVVRRLGTDPARPRVVLDGGRRAGDLADVVAGAGRWPGFVLVKLDDRQWDPRAVAAQATRANPDLVEILRYRADDGVMLLLRDPRPDPDAPRPAGIARAGRLSTP